jgi:hypothetical protein
VHELKEKARPSRATLNAKHTERQQQLLGCIVPIFPATGRFVISLFHAKDEANKIKGISTIDPANLVVI